MTQKLKIYCEDCDLDLDNIALCAQKVLKQRVKMYVDLAIVTKEEIQQLNKQNRNVDSVTDVLSFPTLDGIRGKVVKTGDFPKDYDHDERALFLGSIAICADRAKEQAEQYGHSYNRELHYLLVHGILHLFGYDHMTDSDKAQMRRKEEEILNLLGVTR